MKALFAQAAFWIATFIVLPVHAQAIRLPRPVRGPAVAGAAADSVKPAEESKDEAALEVARSAAPQLGPRHIRLHLLDGSVISGDLSVGEISVNTAFGKLVVPI